MATKIEVDPAKLIDAIMLLSRSVKSCQKTTTLIEASEELSGESKLEMAEPLAFSAEMTAHAVWLLNSMIPGFEPPDVLH